MCDSEVTEGVSAMTSPVMDRLRLELTQFVVEVSTVVHQALNATGTLQLIKPAAGEQNSGSVDAVFNA